MTEDVDMTLVWGCQIQVKVKGKEQMGQPQHAAQQFAKSNRARYSRGCRIVKSDQDLAEVLAS